MILTKTHTFFQYLTVAFLSLGLLSCDVVIVGEGVVLDEDFKSSYAKADKKILIRSNVENNYTVNQQQLGEEELFSHLEQIPKATRDQYIIMINYERLISESISDRMSQKLRDIGYENIIIVTCHNFKC